MKQTCYTAEHSGGLQECIKSERPISYDTFFTLVKIGLYEFYCYDERIKTYRYILKNHYENTGLPTWLHYKGVRRPI